MVKHISIPDFCCVFWEPNAKENPQKSADNLDNTTKNLSKEQKEETHQFEANSRKYNITRTKM